MLKFYERLVPDSGSIAQERSENFARQDIDFEQGRTVLEEAYRGVCRY
jgi:hypothetical protein